MRRIVWLLCALAVVVWCCPALAQPGGGGQTPPTPFKGGVVDWSITYTSNNPSSFNAIAVVLENPGDHASEFRVNFYDANDDLIESYAVDGTSESTLFLGLSPTIDPDNTAVWFELILTDETASNTIVDWVDGLGIPDEKPTSYYRSPATGVARGKQTYEIGQYHTKVIAIIDAAFGGPEMNYLVFETRWKRNSDSEWTTGGSMSTYASCTGHVAECLMASNFYGSFSDPVQSLSGGRCSIEVCDIYDSVRPTSITLQVLITQKKYSDNTAVNTPVWSDDIVVNFN